jgi:energy-coupling factor transporter ATP-binding protein EcfA2
MELLLENIRTFSGKHNIPLRPLTLVVGENSTGKSTFLGMLAAVLREGFPDFKFFMHSPPFDYGGYDTLATNRGGKYGRSSSFSLGFTVEPTENRIARSMKVTFSDDHGQPRMTVIEGDSRSARLDCAIAGSDVSGRIKLQLPQGQEVSYSFSLQVSDEVLAQPFPLLYSAIYRAILDSERKKSGSEPFPERVLQELSNLLFGLGYGQEKSIALAPVRTKPRRTYDEGSDIFRPEGDHIPLMMAKLWDDDSGRGKILHAALRDFGAESGLFKDLDIKKLGKRPGSPFQVMVKMMAGPKVNLPDVGYGVSQALPIVVESVLAGQSQWLLLQQPEVHLHPRAQAALGTLFSRLASNQNVKFVVETHSEYILDRVRLEIAKGTIPIDTVQVLFFDRPRMWTKVHKLTFDVNGNILHAPPSYRKFLLAEEQNLLDRVQ